MLLLTIQMMLFVNSREQIHEDSLNSWINSNYKGIIKGVTGIGKLSIFFKSLYILRKEVNLQQEEVWFYRETILGKDTLIKECIEFEKREGLNPCNDFNIQFVTYQSKKIGNPFYICLDECDFIGSILLKPIRNMNVNYVMGLTATLSSDKRKLYDGFLPLVYNYTRSQAEIDGHVNPLKTYIIPHELDNTFKKFKVWKNSTFLVTEKEYYDKKIEYCNWDQANPNIVLSTRKYNLPSFLSNLPSKIKIFKNTKNNIKGKCLVFCKEIKYLEKLNIPILNGINDKGYIEDFNEGKLQFLGATSKKLGRGINLDSVENIFLFSSGKSFTDISQIIGRSRLKENIITNLYVIVTKNTYEEKWIKEVNKEKNGFHTIESFNLNIQK